MHICKCNHSVSQRHTFHLLVYHLSAQVSNLPVPVLLLSITYKNEIPAFPVYILEPLVKNKYNCTETIIIVQLSFFTGILILLGAVRSHTPTMVLQSSDARQVFKF